MLRCLLGAMCLLLCASCAQLPQFMQSGTTAGGLPMRPAAPVVRVSSVQLVQHPTNEMLAGHFCPQVAPAFVCRALMRPPTPEQLRFVFRIDLDVQNPNSIPLPVVDILAGFTAYPQASGQQNLGAVCMSLCEPGQSCPQGGADACRGGTEPEIRTPEDFVQAAAGFLFAVATGAQRVENLRVRTIPAGGQTRVSIQLELRSDLVLRLLQTLAQDAIAQIRSGRTPSFSIPYRVEGSLWITIENFGRFGANFGPHEGTLNL